MYFILLGKIVQENKFNIQREVEMRDEERDFLEYLIFGLDVFKVIFIFIFFVDG